MAEDSHRRISDLHHGGPIPSQEEVLRGMKGLEKDIKDKHEKKKALRIEGDKILELMRAPLREIILGDKRTEEALKRQKERIERLRRIKLEVPPLPKFPSRIVSGSIISIIGAPYDYAWTNTDNGEATANANGGLQVGVGVSGSSGFASAGVGTAFRPISSGLVRFAAWITYNYDWLDIANFTTSHTDAFFGIFVQKFDLDWNHISDTDIRTSLWSDGVGWLDEHSDSGSGYINENGGIYLTLSSENNYIFWTWFDTSADAGPFSEGYVAANVGFMVFEQYSG
jgi:hypothetical protein